MRLEELATKPAATTDAQVGLLPGLSSLHRACGTDPRHTDTGLFRRGGNLTEVGGRSYLYSSRSASSPVSRTSWMYRQMSGCEPSASVNPYSCASWPEGTELWFQRARFRVRRQGGLRNWVNRTWWFLPRCRDVLKHVGKDRGQSHARSQPAWRRRSADRSQKWCHRAWARTASAHLWEGSLELVRALAPEESGLGFRSQDWIAAMPALCGARPRGSASCVRRERGAGTAVTLL